MSEKSDLPPLYSEEGRRLQAVRKALGFRQVEFAKAIGVSKQRLNNWEAGIVFCRPEHMKLLYRQFGIGADYLLNGVPTALPSDLIAKAHDELAKIEDENLER